jgi:hypothetical protein
MNQFYPSSIPPPLLAEVSHMFFSSCNRTPTAVESRRHTYQTHVYRSFESRVCDWINLKIQSRR